MQDNHAVEVRIYQQKVKHLEYEHRNNLRIVEAESGQLIADEQAEHVTAARQALKEKEVMKDRKSETDAENAQKIMEVSVNG